MSNSMNLIDIPLEGGGNDLLNIENYVKSLKEYIALAAMPTTIAIQGEWGSGKTSMMNQIYYELCDDKEERELDAPFHGIWLNMWEYSLMKSPEEVLINVIKGLTVECTRILERNGGANNEKAETFKKTMSSFIKKAGIFGATVLAKKAGDFVGFGDEAAKAVQNHLNADNSKEDDLDDEVRPAQIRQALQDVVDSCLEADHSTGDTKKKGFLFFIDDLDRINPVDAVHILELLKNLFEVENCIFVLAIDYEVVVKGLKAKFGEGNQDDRAYRSFFDKIIQLPFSMPISSYDVSNFLKSALLNMNFMSETEMNTEVTLEDDEKMTYLESLENFVYWSTGANPRAIKRLLNSLLLIKIMQKNTQGEISESYCKAVNFAFVCMQIAYPEVYDCLLKENNFLEWNEESARKFAVKRISDDKLEEISSFKEFDEEWEQVLYSVCQKNSFLSNRAQMISKLFNTVRFMIPSDLDFGETITNILDMSAVTTVSNIDKASTQRGKQKQDHTKSDDINFYLDRIKDSCPQVLIDKLASVATKMIEKYKDVADVKVSKTEISLWCKESKVRGKKFASLCAFRGKKQARDIMYLSARVWPKEGPGEMELPFSYKTGELLDRDFKNTVCSSGFYFWRKSSETTKDLESVLSPSNSEDDFWKNADRLIEYAFNSMSLLKL